jgi:hypothetical protein
MEEFCWFLPPKDQDAAEGPPSAAGAAMLALCEARQVPGFAMAFYDALATAGEGDRSRCCSASMGGGRFMAAHRSIWR